VVLCYRDLKSAQIYFEKISEAKALRPQDTELHKLASAVQQAAHTMGLVDVLLKEALPKARKRTLTKYKPEGLHVNLVTKKVDVWSQVNGLLKGS
jgi:hypothetical protein